jgi:hypothetical protein
MERPEHLHVVSSSETGEPLTEEELSAWEERAKGPADWAAYDVLRLIAEVRRLKAALAANGGEGATGSVRCQGLASTEADVSTHTGASVLAMIEEIWAKVPEAEMEKLPTDLAEQHDHYIYGLPKRAP